MSYSSVALLVDGDNISSTFAGQVLRKSSDLGPLAVRRVYGNAATMSGWAQAPSFKLVHSGTGKNSSDILLCIEAMEFALVQDMTAFAIVTSDSDFSHVAHRLRELGRHVLGIGEAKAPECFRKACSDFRQLNPPVARVADIDLEELDRKIRELLAKEDPDNMGVLVNTLNAKVRKLGRDFKISDREEKNWLNYLKARPSLYNLIGQGQDRRVHIAAGLDSA